MSSSAINIAKDFSRFPSGRFRSDGPHSGEKFREDLLAPALKHCQNVTVELDGVAGLPASFLEETFGGLIRKHQFTAQELISRIEFVAATPRMRTYPQMIRAYLERANGVSLVAAE